MAKIQITKKFPLDTVGDEWKECYIVLKSFTISDIEKNQKYIFAKGLKKDDKGNEIEPTTEETMQRLQTIIELVKENFVSGKVYDSESKTVVAMTVEDVAQFPLEILSEVISFLSPKTEKKS